ncbi:MAG: carbohydrate ABC transporter permease [Clostridia bacterium]|nr:carbohydrate ABC transporter permease [Clostridia bacterium]
MRTPKELRLPRNRKPITLQGVLKQLLCLFLSLLVLAPFYLVLVNSFKTKNESARMNLSLPKEWLFSNYSDVFQKANLMTGFVNSMIYALVSTTCGVLLCAMAAYVLSRKRTRLNNFVYYFFICGLFFPVNYITLVRVFQWMNLTNTRFGIILVFTSAMIPFCIFTIYSFVETIPRELDEAAVIDGASPARLFFQVVLPLLKPTIFTCFVLQFMGVWNDFLTPLYLSSKSKLFPMTMSVYQFFGRESSHWNYVFADIVLTIIPVVAVYAIGQRYIIGGVTAGAVKG